MYKEYDFLVIGSGIAGLSYALKVAEYGSVCIISKSCADETSTRYAQGGIAAVMYTPDTFEKHISDTIKAGAGLCDEEIVKLTISEGKERVENMIELGTRFDKTNHGTYDLSREGGHSEYRVLHYKDRTGVEIENSLLKAVKQNKNIELLENQFAVDLITEHHLGFEVNKRTPSITCFGAYVLDPKTTEISVFAARITLMASGGIGRIYATTTNPPVSTGDGIAMVYRAKGKIENMEFVQFHPTSLYNPNETPSFLITEALRGFGAILKTIDGKEFMQKYDSRLSLAPRDIVARAIDNEIKISGEDYVYLDCLHLNKRELIERFPTIYAKCLSIGVDITKEMIPVVPAAHYSCGGISTDKWGRTSINNLYAAGECAHTGMHGANRLASNSLLESVVFANRAAINASEKLKETKIQMNIPVWNAEGMVLNEEMVLITQTTKELQQIMTYYVGIVRSNIRLERAFTRLELLYRETEELYNKSILSPRICELRNMINTAYLVIKMAIIRKQSIGLHYSIDYPPPNNKTN